MPLAEMIWPTRYLRKLGDLERAERLAAGGADAIHRGVLGREAFENRRRPGEHGTIGVGEPAEASVQVGVLALAVASPATWRRRA